MRDIARFNVVTCKVTDDIPHVAKKMVDAEVGSIFVEDKGKVIGLITDGQIFRLVADRENLDKKTAKDIMVTPLKEVDVDASLKDALEIFQKTGFKRLAVTEKGKIVGVLSRKLVQRFSRFGRAKTLTK
ncbi:MAG: CBS domain-containing protein [Candidatus Freyarchaeum deiterrae]